MRKLSSKLKASLASYREVEVYASFAADLDTTTVYTLNRGSKLVELLKQKKHSPLSRDQQVLLLFAGVNGYVDKLPMDLIQEFKNFLLRFARTSNIFFELNPYKELYAPPFEEFMEVALNSNLWQIKNISVVKGLNGNLKNK